MLEKKRSPTGRKSQMNPPRKKKYMKKELLALIGIIFL
jgi:hypothetical protein